MYDIKVINIASIGEVNLTITNDHMCFKFDFYGSNRNNKIVQKNGFRFTEILKLKIKIDSTLSNINICYYSKLPIQILHREYFRIIPQNPE